MKHRVVIVQQRVPPYRVPFFTGLSKTLAERDVELVVASSEGEVLPAPLGVRVALRQVGPMIYQDIGHLVKSADLVIVEQANRFVWNPVLMFLAMLKIRRLAFWGHGSNRQGQQNSLREVVKKLSLAAPDGWFAYTETTQLYLRENGITEEKICLVQNSIDTRQLQQMAASLDAAEKKTLRESLRIPEGAHVAMYCGRLDKEKGCDLMAESIRLIARTGLEVHWIIAGEGPFRAELERIERVHCVGYVDERRKAALLSISQVFVLPAAVGLAILDAFAAGLPFLTTDASNHGPEIAYLQPGENGLVCAMSAAPLAELVRRVLTDADLRDQLGRGAKRSADEYSIEQMVANFAEGVSRFLN